MASLFHCMEELTYLLLFVLFLGGCENVVKEDPKTTAKKTPINYDKLSVEELQPLAKGGDAEAQGVLAPMYMLGEGVPQDQQKGIELFRLSAAQGNSEFQWLLGATYLLGKGVPQDYQEAVKWIRKAAEQGDEDCVEQQNIIARKMTTSQILKAQRLAREFKPKKENP